MRKIMVTGAAGFIGHALADCLSRQPDTYVYVVDNLVRGEADTAYRDLCARENVEEFALDLTLRDAVDRLPDRVDVIYHMAALNGTQNFYERPYDVVRCCTLPTLHLLDRFGTRSGLERFVYAGSSESYAGTVSTFEWPVPTDETVPLCIADPRNVRWSYGGSKLHGELAVVAAGRQVGSAFTIIRYHNIYGPRMGDKHVVPDFLARAKKGVYSLYGYDQTRSFIYVDDAVRATMQLADSRAAANQIVNVGSETEVSILDMATQIMKILGVDSKIELFDAPPGSVARRAPDISKLKRLVAFRETVSLEEGLRRTIDYYLS